MFRSVKLALLTLACSLMLLHNLTPHIHHSGLITDEFEIKRIAPNKAGLLQEIFQLDLGCNHLEEASQSKFDFTT
ncbi:MAG TPA: hypothetical protein PKC24_01210, partial [Cyclobacteriaceae bacterium]|nr:hypothetical protein [Cyclobacteriaceae bacterium]